MKNGEIQVIPENYFVMGVDESDTSVNWHTSLQNGTCAAPGTADTLKINGSEVDNNTQTANRTGSPVLDIKHDKPSYTGGDVNGYFGYTVSTFEIFAVAAGVSVPILVKALGLFPLDTNCAKDYLYVRNY